jgi:hypothetical protein
MVMLKIVFLAEKQQMAARPSSLRYRIVSVADFESQVTLTLVPDVPTEKIDATEVFAQEINENRDIPEELKKSIIETHKASIKANPPPSYGTVRQGQIIINVPQRLYHQIGSPGIKQIVLLQLEVEVEST